MRAYILLLFASSSLATEMGSTFTVSKTRAHYLQYGAYLPLRLKTLNCVILPQIFFRPAIFTDTSAGSATPSQVAGWAAPAFSSISFFVPDNWSSGRIWISASAPVAVYWLLTASYAKGGRDRDSSTNPGPNSCLDGGCNGGLLCDAQTGTGGPPATVAEFTLSTDPSVPDYYDSLRFVDGDNLLMRVDNDHVCGVPLRGVDPGPNCQPSDNLSHDFSLNSSNDPAPLQGPYGWTEFPVGCKSASAAGLVPDSDDSPNCCTGSYNTVATCPSLTGVQYYYYYYFKSNCPNMYVYDESSGTAPFLSNQADYTVTFCP
ncbi:thaumatin-like protein [Lactarius pseudohatsudake]|nr:thaumatin-like protein [Lactarius pseudohatsudake]